MKNTFQYRLYPSNEQKVALENAFGCSRFVFNKALEFKKSAYDNEKKNISLNYLNSTFLQSLKSEHEFLKKSSAQSLQQSIRHLYSAYQNFFKKRAGFPNFKRKFSKQSVSFPQSVKVDFKAKLTTIPKIGKIKTKFHRRFQGDIKTCTITKEPTGKYFISILIEDHLDLPKKIQGDNIIGIDLGIIDFAVLSSGIKIPNPKYLKKSLRKLQEAQRKLSKLVLKSQNWKKQKLRIARIYERINNKRKDFLHKVSKMIIDNNHVIFIEDLDVQGLLEKAHRYLAREISDISWATFVIFLLYKAERYGKIVFKIGRYEPSSKKCSYCGYIHKDLKLGDRTWICPICGKEHDRDFNSSTNIRDIGLEQPEFNALMSSLGWTIGNHRL